MGENWNVFLDDIYLNNSTELSLANLDLNEPVLERVTLMMVILLRGYPPHQHMQILDWILRRMEEKAIIMVVILMIVTCRSIANNL